MRRAITTTAIAATLAGCADPYTQTDPRPVQGEQPAKTTQPAQDRVPRSAAARTPEAAARRAAELAGNWTGETISQRYTELGRMTIGEARDSAQQVAAQASTDQQLSAPGARSIAIVHAIATRGTGRRRRLIVVTHETVTADATRTARWRVTIAEAQRRRNGWVISRWEPQP